MKNERIPEFFAVIVIAVIFMCLTACTHTRAQKKPWPVGKSPIYFTKRVTLPYTAPLTIDAYYFDDFNEYDGAHHFIYDVHDANNKIW